MLILKYFFLLILFIILPFQIFSWNFIKNTATESLNTDNSKVLIVLGAGLIQNKPSKVLRQRLDKALEIYLANLNYKILVSGDNRSVYYNEPLAMKEYLIEKGVNKDSIFLDFAGNRTFDSCWRAKNVFKIKKATLISQAYHLPRAVSICQNLGIESNAVAADGDYRANIYSLIREIPATWTTVYDFLTGYVPDIQANGDEPDLS